MTNLTDTAARSSALRKERERADVLVVVALALAFVLAMFGLAMSGDPRPEIANGGESPFLIGP